MTDRRTAVAALLAVCGVASLALSLFSVAGVFASDAVTGNVTVEAHANNGEYVSLVERDGGEEVVVHVNDSVAGATGTGVNDRAVTTVDDVLVVTNEGSNVTSVWTEDDAEGVQFYRSVPGRPSIEGDENAVALESGESVAVGVRIDTVGDHGDVVALDSFAFRVADGVVAPDDGDGDGVDRTAAPRVGPVLRVLEAADGTGEWDLLRVRVERLRRGDRVVLDRATVSGGGAADGPVALENVSVRRYAWTATGAGEVDVSLTARAASPARERAATLAVPPADWPGGPLPPAAFARATGQRPVGYVAVEQSGSAAGLRDASVRFAVPQRYLRAVGADADAVTAYRRRGGEWVPVETARVGRGHGSVAYEAAAPAASTLAVGVDAPAVSAGGLSAPDRATVGETVRVVATVANNGSRTERAVRLTADGAPVGTQTVSLPPGASRRVTFRVAFDDPGTYDLAVGSATERVDVRPADATPRATDGGDSRTGGSPDGRRPGDAPVPPLRRPLATGIAVAAVAGLGWAFLRRARGG